MKILTVFFIIVFGVTSVSANEPCADINKDGQVDITDFLILTEQYGQETECAAQKPSVVMVQVSGVASMGFNYSYFHAFDHGQYGQDRMVRMDIDFDGLDFSTLLKVIDNGYTITDFYFTKTFQHFQMIEQNHHQYRPPRYYLSKNSGRWLFGMMFFANNAQDELRHFGIQYDPSQPYPTHAYGQIPYTLFFVLLRNENIIKSGNNSTE